MDPTYTEEAETFRTRIGIPDSNLRPGGPATARCRSTKRTSGPMTRQKLAANGLLAPWPAEFRGGGMSELEQVILAEEFEKAGAPTGGGNGAF